VVALLTVGLFNLVGEFAGLYRRWQGVAFEREATCASITWVITFILLAGLGHLSLYSTELQGSSLD